MLEVGWLGLGAGPELEDPDADAVLEPGGPEAEADSGVPELGMLGELDWPEADVALELGAEGLEVEGLLLSTDESPG